MKKIILSVAAAVLTVFGLAGVANFAPAYADTAATKPSAKVICPNGEAVNSLEDCNDKETGYGKLENTGAKPMEIAQNIVTWVCGIIGFLAVVMIVIGGLNYTLSQGEASKVKKAKDTILFGVIGLVIALLAFGIVNFVLTNVLK